MTAFLSVFPLLLVATAVLGFIAAGSTDLPSRIIKDLGFSGTAADTVREVLQNAEKSRKAASVVGLVGLLWSGLGLVSVIQSAYNAIWQVKGRGIKDKAVGLAWLLGAFVILAASVTVTAVLGAVSPWLAPVGVVAGLAIDVVLFLWTSKVLPNRDVGWRALLPGALLGAVGLAVLKVVGTFYVPRAVASASGLYGSIGVVFAVLAWLFFFARLVVYAAVLDVVRWEEHHGTVTAEVEVPRVPGQVPVETSRGGQVLARSRTEGGADDVRSRSGSRSRARS